MESKAKPETTFGEVRMRTIRGMAYFHVEAETTMADLSSTIGASIAKLAQAEAAGPVRSAGPILFRYLGSTEPFRLQVGFPVDPATEPVGDAHVTTLEPFPCASLVYGGDLAHLSEAYATLSQEMQAQDLGNSDEMWEWYLYFEDDASANNVTWLLHGIAS